MPGVNFSNRRGTGVVTADGFDIADAKGESVGVLPVYSAVTTVTLAQLNAGKEILPAIPGKAYKIVGYLLKPAGALGGATSVVLRDNSETPIVVTTALVAALTDGAKISSEAVVSNVTDGVGLHGNLGVGKSLNIAKVGSNGTTMTSMLVKVLYNIVNP